MKRLFFAPMIVLLSVYSAGCAPSATQLEKIVKENPDIVFSAIKADPLKFFEVVREAESAAQAQAAKKQEDAFKEQMEEEFQTPKNPVVEEDRVIFGPKEAPITIVEYSDFQCGYCSKAHATMKQLREKYGDKIRIVYKHLPFQRPYGRPAAEYFEAVAIQDGEKAEKFHNYVFENQGDLRSEGEEFLKKTVKKVGANVNKVLKDLKSDQVKERIEKDMEEARKFEFTGTPGFIVNGVILKGAYPIEIFTEVIDRHLTGNKKEDSGQDDEKQDEEKKDS